MKRLSGYPDLPCELPTPLFVTGISMEESCMGQFIVFPVPVVTFSFEKSWFYPSLPFLRLHLFPRICMASGLPVSPA
jgi:hypothetical protein